MRTYPNTKSLLHVSTLYSNCDKKFIAEKVYEQEIAYEKIMEVIMHIWSLSFYFILAVK